MTTPPKSDQSERSPDDLAEYPKFEERDVVLRWDANWWDGPMDGSIAYRARRYLFEFYCDGAGTYASYYYYLVYPLTDQEAEYADAWNTERERFQAEFVRLANDPATKDSASTKEVADKL